MSFDFNKLARSWPSAIVARTEVSRFSGGLLSPRTLANLDSLKQGPPRRRCGKKVFYEAADLCAWMARRAQADERGDG